MFLSHGTSNSGKSPYLSVLDTELDLLNRNVEIYPARQLLLLAIGKLRGAAIQYRCLFLFGSLTIPSLEGVKKHKLMEHK